MPQAADVVVIGAGQAGLSAAYHLRRRGFVPAVGAASGERTYVVLDAEVGPGGAWRHRWRSLRMSTVNGIHDLPGIEQPDVEPEAASVDVLPAYFGDYEHELGLAVARPVRVRRVERADDEHDAPGGDLLVRWEGAGRTGTVAARAIVNATGTWSKPFWPAYPGQETFRGRQLHTADYLRAEDFAGQRVAVVGGGISAVQLLEEVSHVARTFWFTRREPVWRDSFDSQDGARAVAMVADRVREGLPPQSVVSVTGLIRTPSLLAAGSRGVLDRRPMFTRIAPDGVVTPDGELVPVDVILWNTGFRAALDHLRPLHLRGTGGGIRMDGTQVDGEPRAHLIGYGPSASTVGANRAGRDAVNRIARYLQTSDPRRWAFRP